ncbi:hypothetical protein G6F37_007647 [Rhizopus arrhizus]|nr:hypothetical protein G6F38_010474 [Rhizopus arrhizus]KAG1156400.1 hypothetical protein G6F37_007647 [Rhizopus arrhizus]
MLVLLGNFPGLRSVYIVKVNMIPVPGSTNVFMDKLRELYFTSVPDNFTMSILRVCGNYNSDPSKDVCSPASLGFRYSSTDELLDTLQSQIPPSLHSELAGIQGGVFIVSVILCFLLLVYYFYHQYAERHTRFGWCWISLSLLLTALALIFAVATFAIQIYIHNLVRDAVNSLGSGFLGSLFSEFVQIKVSIGPSLWMSLVAFVLLFLVFILLSVTTCCINRRRSENTTTNNNPPEMRST